MKKNTFPSTECACNAKGREGEREKRRREKEQERMHVLAYSQKCESWWFCFGGAVNPYTVSIPHEFSPLSFTLGYGVSKIILKTIPIKLQRCSFLQDEVIKNHQVFAVLLPEIICFPTCSGNLASLKSL